MWTALPAVGDKESAADGRCFHGFLQQRRSTLAANCSVIYLPREQDDLHQASKPHSYNCAVFVRDIVSIYARNQDSPAEKSAALRPMEQLVCLPKLEAPRHRAHSAPLD